MEVEKLLLSVFTGSVPWDLLKVAASEIWPVDVNLLQGTEDGAMSYPEGVFLNIQG